MSGSCSATHEAMSDDYCNTIREMQNSLPRVLLDFVIRDSRHIKHKDQANNHSNIGQENNAVVGVSERMSYDWSTPDSRLDAALHEDPRR